MNSADFDILCAVARPRPDLERLRTLLRGSIGFRTTLDLAFAHYLGPQFLAAMSDLGGEGVPAESRSRLEDFRRRHMLRTLYLAEELCRIAGIFSSHGITFAAFKGAALAIDLYGDPARREYSDIDLIVPIEQVSAAETALEGLGYRNDQGDRAFRQMFCAYQGQYSFGHADLDASVDLHWAFTAAGLPFPLEAGELWSNLRPLGIGTCTVPTLAEPDLALLLAGHGTKEGWRSLGWICDFAAFAHSRADLDWPGLHERARRRGCGDALLLAYALSNTLLDVAIPPGLADDLARNRRVRGIAATIVDKLRAGSAGSARHHLMDVMLCDRPWDRIRVACRLIFTPTPGDYRALPLPQALWGLYYGLRPFRLAAFTSLRRDREAMVGQKL